MRESNFSFPVQNRAAVVISSQLYDRRALDTTSPLPLFNSLTHLTYLTSTSPRIRDILTVDGGLERLVRLLRDFCAHPPPPQSPRAIYGLKPAVKHKKAKDKGKQTLSDPTAVDWLNYRPPVPQNDGPSASAPAINPLTSFDRTAAFRFSLAFQCVVNIGVRGSEAVRARVVQAGMLDVVSSVLECWLVSKGFAVCPSPTGSGAPRESREVRVARRMELLERRQRDFAGVQPQDLHRALRALPAGTISQARAQLETVEQLGLPSHSASALPAAMTVTFERARLEANQADDEWPDITEEPISQLPTSDPPSIMEEEQGDESDAMDGSEDTSTLHRRSTIRAHDQSLPAIFPHHPTAISEQSTGSSGNIASSSSASSSSSALPLAVPRRPSVSQSGSSGNISDSISADTSANATPVGGNTPTGSVTIEAQSRERSGTVVARPVWDPPAGSPSRRQSRNSALSQLRRHRRNDGSGPGTDDDLTTEPEVDAEAGRGPGQPSNDQHAARMAVIVQADVNDGAGMDMNMIVNQGPLQGVGMGVEQGLVNLDLQANDDLAMGAPPGAPGAVQNIAIPQQGQQGTHHTPDRQGAVGPQPHIGGTTPRQLNDLTPRAVMVPLVTATPTQTRMGANGTIGPITGNHPPGPPTAATTAQAISTVQLALNGASVATYAANGSTSNSADDQSAGPYREEDVLLSLQLLAYLSKYPHVRQAFYKPRVPLGPPLYPPLSSPSPPSNNDPTFNLNSISINVMMVGPTSESSSETSTPSEADGAQPATPSNLIEHAPNVFSLVERFTFRPSPSELHLPRLPHEIQYWAGVIMRNACRKDETRGGIRQCANMVCGKWESFPREFAKCRRCRKAKYCGKECQSKAWADGHRFWCSSRDAEGGDGATAAGETDTGPNHPPGGSGGRGDAHMVPLGSTSQARLRATIVQTAARHAAAMGAYPDPGSLADRFRAPATVAAVSAGQLARPNRTNPAHSQTTQPPSNQNLVVRLSHPSRTQRPSGDPARERARAEAVSQLLRNAELAGTVGSLRPRHPPHAAAPAQAGTSSSAAIAAMELDSRSPPPGVRRRAGTLPSAPTPPNNDLQPSASRPQTDTVTPSDILTRQEGLRDMIRVLAADRLRSGLPPIAGLTQVEQDVMRLISNHTLSSGERSLALRRILRDFETILDRDMPQEAAPPGSGLTPLDEDGDSRMA